MRANWARCRACRSAARIGAAPFPRTRFGPRVAQAWHGGAGDRKTHAGHRVPRRREISRAGSPLIVPVRHFGTCLMFWRRALSRISEGSQPNGSPIIRIERCGEQVVVARAARGSRVLGEKLRGSSAWGAIPESFGNGLVDDVGLISTAERIFGTACGGAVTILKDMMNDYSKLTGEEQGIFISALSDYVRASPVRRMEMVDRWRLATQDGASCQVRGKTVSENRSE
ncbi:hypothetical protein BTRA_5253 [Burkholderia thailandensis USAMRU Malaysia |nr:hypothetical protein BTJ_4527 [Burkholderia thailandensis E444]AIC90538.1 hypothetical protein BTRA_5253 [Burkholderia thailandensis USAMRU Malaysia \